MKIAHFNVSATPILDHFANFCRHGEPRGRGHPGCLNTWIATSAEQTRNGGGQG